jgi:pimeloyl-ACP methyl ester carboxylesterase
MTKGRRDIPAALRRHPADGTVGTMERTWFTAPTAHGAIAGWVAGEGAPVLVLHGGPGLGHEYLDPMAEEVLEGAYRVALFQQRGLSPSTHEGPFTIARAVADVEAVLDHLGWDRALVVGHSWGGHLAFHLAVALPHRLLGVLAVDPLGGVGDGGAAAFGAELLRRVPDDLAGRARELEALDSSGAATAADQVELLEILWPSYFATPEGAPPFPAVRLAQAASEGLWADLIERLPTLDASLETIGVPVGVLAGSESPMPPDVATVATVDRIPGAWCVLEPDAGHFTWVEHPGCVLSALDRLSGRVAST